VTTIVEYSRNATDVKVRMIIITHTAVVVDSKEMGLTKLEDAPGGGGAAATVFGSVPGGTGESIVATLGDYYS
jgi:hypothetical protein